MRSWLPSEREPSLLLQQGAAHGAVFVDVAAAEEDAMAGDGVELPERDALLPSGLQRMYGLVALNS